MCVPGGRLGKGKQSQSSPCPTRILSGIVLGLSYKDDEFVFRKQHKEQMTTLQMQLKSASHSSKGGEKESDRMKKDLDKTRQDDLPGCHTASKNPCLIPGIAHLPVT